MRTGTPFTVCLALLAVAAAVGAELKAREPREEAGWLLARATAHAEQYVDSFDGAEVDAQLAAFAERRTALARAERWEQARSAAVLLAGLLLLLAYVQGFFWRLEGLRLDGDTPAPAAPGEDAGLAVAASR